MGIMITYYGYNNGYNNPVYNVHKNVGAYYTRQNMVFLVQKLPHLWYFVITA